MSVALSFGATRLSKAASRPPTALRWQKVSPTYRHETQTRPAREFFRSWPDGPKLWKYVPNGIKGAL